MMKKVSKLKRHFMVLALTVTFVGLNVDMVFAVSSNPTPAPSKDAIATQATQKPSQKDAEDKTNSSSKFDISKGFSSIAEKAIMAVVNVSTTQIIEGGRPGKEGFPQFAPGSPFEDLFKEFFDQMERPRKVQSLGSGFIIQSTDTSATIVTNYHVIADAKKITVFLNDNTELDATLASFDERTDLAILKVNTEFLPEGKRKLHTMEWGDSNAVKVGDWILAIGNPFGLGSTVTSGIVSNRSRDIMLGRAGKTRVNDYVDDFMQHDAAINMGNSGGPLLSLDGKVVGINTAIFSPSGGNIGIGFAIPAAVAQDTVAQLLKYGRTKRGWLGVRIQVVTDDIAESLGLGKARGAIVSSVTPDGPAAKAKIEPEDIILEFDGKEVNEKARLNRLVGETQVGKTVKVKVLRKGKEMNFDVVLGEFETAPDRVSATPVDKSKAAKDQTVETLGIKLSALSPELRERFDLKEAKGIMVMKVDPNSTAVEIGLKGVDRDGPGDIIEKVIEKEKQIELNKPEDFVKIVDEAKKANRKNILLLVTRKKNESRFVALKLENDDLKETPKDGGKDSNSKGSEKEKAEAKKAG
jgi:serine protease Do